MHQVFPASAPRFGVGLLMPTPGPLGRLLRRRRAELALTQAQLSQLTAQYGAEVPQNLISRIESGKSQRINDVARLRSLAKALGLESEAEFVLAAYAPRAVQEQRHRYDIAPELIAGPHGELIAILPNLPSEAVTAILNMARLLAEPPEPTS